MKRLSRPPAPTAAELAYHVAGLALLGEIAPLAVVPPMPPGDPQNVVSAVVAVWSVDRAWPVDVGRVADVLLERGQWWPMGGASYVIPMIETCRARMDRARELGELLAAAIVLADRLDAASATDDELLQLVDRREQARDLADRALSELRRLTGVASNNSETEVA